MTTPESDRYRNAWHDSAHRIASRHGVAGANRAYDGTTSRLPLSDPSRALPCDPLDEHRKDGE